MESKLMPGLHFIGEVVDVTGWLGGYNPVGVVQRHGLRSVTAECRGLTPLGDATYEHHTPSVSNKSTSPAKHNALRGVSTPSLQHDIMNDLMSMGMHRLWKATPFAASGA